jgi:hypothetical protein
MLLGILILAISQSSAVDVVDVWPLPMQVQGGVSCSQFAVLADATVFAITTEPLAPSSVADASNLLSDAFERAKARLFYGVTNNVDAYRYNIHENVGIVWPPSTCSSTPQFTVNALRVAIEHSDIDLAIGVNESTTANFVVFCDHTNFFFCF